MLKNKFLRIFKGLRSTKSNFLRYLGVLTKFQDVFKAPHKEPFLILSGKKK